ncbi:MAG: glutamate racemase [Tissierellia bacterium]|nr:glutamate racemase [Tissierellia bacterium]
MENRPIGVFDSGIGGLTVLKELSVILPNEDLIYFGDTARVPYGTRSKETIIRYSLQCSEFLKSKDVKMIVIACNTASAFALDEVRDAFDIPVVGVIRPGGEAAAKATECGTIGVIGTEGTINSRSYEIEIRKNLPEAKVIGQPCPLFVQLVEEGWADTDVTELVAKKYLLDMKDHEIDTLVLGCTHYPPLRYMIRKVLGDEINLINPALETAVEVKKILEEKNLLTERNSFGEISYYVSDSPEKFRRIGGNLVQMNIKDPKKVDVDI